MWNGLSHAASILKYQKPSTSPRPKNSDAISSNVIYSFVCPFCCSWYRYRYVLNLSWVLSQSSSPTILKRRLIPFIESLLCYPRSLFCSIFPLLAFAGSDLSRLARELAAGLRWGERASTLRLAMWVLSILNFTSRFPRGAACLWLCTRFDQVQQLFFQLQVLVTFERLSVMHGKNYLTNVRECHWMPVLSACDFCASMQKKWTFLFANLGGNSLFVCAKFLARTILRVTFLHFFLLSRYPASRCWLRSEMREEILLHMIWSVRLG